MKQIIYTFAATVLCAFIFTAILSVDARAIRENEMQCALSDAVREAVEEVHVSDLRYSLTDDELVALFEQLLLTRLSVNGKATGEGTDMNGDPNFSLTVDIAGVDASRGLLFAHVKETFTYPNGKVGTLEDTAALLIEQESSRDMVTVTYEHTDEFLKKNEADGNAPMDKNIRVYHVEADQPIPHPSDEGEWVLVETTADGDMTYIPANEALSTDTESVLPAQPQDSASTPAQPQSSATPTNSQYLALTPAQPQGPASTPAQPQSPTSASSPAEPVDSASTSLPTESVDSTTFSEAIWEESSLDDGAPSEPDVLVAVIDTGIDLSQNENPESPLYHRISPLTDSSITDPVGHGTAMASIIAANTPSNVKILALRAFDKDGHGSSEISCDAMEQALRDGADILNLSFSGEGVSTRMKEMVRSASKAGCVIIAAAGNKGANADNYIPANIESVITISAVDETQCHASYSNQGSCVDFAADGFARLSMGTADTADDKLYIGTSVATAHASSYAALLLSSAGEDSIDVRRSFLSSAIDLGDPGRDDLYGNGYLSAERLIQVAREYDDDFHITPLPETPSDGTTETDVPAVYADEDVVISESAIKTKDMRYTTSTPIQLSNFGAGATITVAWDNANGIIRNGGVIVSCKSGTITNGSNFIKAVSDNGDFTIKLKDFNFSRSNQSTMSHAIIILVSPGTRPGFVYTMAGRENKLSSYSYSMNPVDNDFLYEPYGGYTFAASTVGAIIIKKQPVAYWCSTPESTAIPTRDNDEEGCTIFVSPSIDGQYYYSFYGKWSPKTTTVNYHGNGGRIIGRTSQVYEYSYTETTRYVETLVSHPGYTLTGWNTSPDGTGRSFANGFDLAPYTASRDAERETIDLYAMWSSTAYVVHFNPTPTSIRANNIKGDPYSTEPTGSMPDQSMEVNDSVRLHECTFQRKGYTFYGWALDPLSNKYDYVDKGYAKNIIPATQTKREVTLYAMWTPIKYGIRYNANGANTGNTASQVIFYDQVGTLRANKFYEKFNGQAVSSFVFNCFSTSPTGSGGPKYGIPSDVRNINSPLSDTPKDSWKEQDHVYNLTDVPKQYIYLYAIWDVDFTLSLSADLLSGETNRTDLYDKTAWNYNDTLDSVTFLHLGSLAGADEGPDNPYRRTTFQLPDGYPFVMEKTVTADSRLHYDANAQAYVDYTYRYSQQGWAWNNRMTAGDDIATYRNADYKKGDYLTVSPEHRREPDPSALNYPDWLFYAIKGHPQNVSLDADGFMTVTLYAVWDEAPVVSAYDRYFTRNELGGYLDGGSLCDVLSDTEYLVIRDREDGTLSDGTADGVTLGTGEPAFTLTPHMEELQSLLNSGADRFALSVSVVARDAVSNTTPCTFMIYVTSNEPIRSIEDGPASTRPVASFVRAINSTNYYKHDGSGEENDVAANENGALKAHSLWYEDATYADIIKKALAAIDNDSGYTYTKTYKRKEIKEIQNYCATHGCGITGDDPDRLNDWIRKFH